jgi:protein phosphatase
MISEIRKGLGGLQREGFRQVWRLEAVEDIDSATLVRRPMWTDKRDDHGPFDIIGDVHGCADELETLLGQLGYALTWSPDASGRVARVAHPDGRRLVFAGDLVDRGPRSPDVVRIAMAAINAGGYVVQGNHDSKLHKWMDGRAVKVAHGLQQSIDQLADEPDAFKAALKSFLFDLRSHYWLDRGRLAVAHAGLKEEMIGRGSPAVRDFALYGETTGEIDEFGLPVRADWAAKYRGSCSVVYGHTPVVSAEWVNNTICIDTGCVFGGALTALRWPERDLVSVKAEATYFEPIRPLTPVATAQGSQALADNLLDHADVSGRRWIDTALFRRVVVAEENAAAALEVMSRFAISPQWLAYLPPTMSPVESSPRDGWLERPEEAFAFYRDRGQAQVILEEKHMGSRAVVAVCRSPEISRLRFGTVAPEPGAIWTRTGRSFFSDRATTDAVLSRLHGAISGAGLWDEFKTDWLLLDVEIMPWSAKASSLIEGQYAPVAAASRAGLDVTVEAATRAAARGLPVDQFRQHAEERLARARKYATAWAPYVWPVTGIDDLRVAPFHILASEGAVHFDKPHPWHMSMVERLAGQGDRLVQLTRWRSVALHDEAACLDAATWWEELVSRGGEGMVVKPLDFIARGAKGLIQPALKVRGPEYLRIIYGPEYDAPENLSRLKVRNVNSKRLLALREFALGHEALSRFVAREPLRRTHECVFAILAMESEPIDPRL